ncbi:hypothetical protein [Nocardia arizonensis]|uniref:hypothetical protein n=1 Tax=Nocardia arizonensis TaxID=1141647 RepID=UPI0006D27676|nr:hypothetical protein [Nocardia arizonensis]
MFGSADSTRDSRRGWHAQAGDLLGDDYNVPGIVACGFGIVALACTLTAAGYGFVGWAQVGAVVTALLWLTGIGALVIEHRREQAIEREYGRRGHAPGHRAPLRYGAMTRATDTATPETAP